MIIRLMSIKRPFTDDKITMPSAIGASRLTHNEAIFLRECQAQKGIVFKSKNYRCA